MINKIIILNRLINSLTNSKLRIFNYCVYLKKLRYLRSIISYNERKHCNCQNWEIQESALHGWGFQNIKSEWLTNCTNPNDEVVISNGKKYWVKIIHLELNIAVFLIVNVEYKSVLVGLLVNVVVGDVNVAWLVCLR